MSSVKFVGLACHEAACHTNNRPMRTFIIDATLSLRHVSALNGPSSGSTTDTFPEQGRQNELPDVKLSLASSGFLLHFVRHFEEIGGWKARGAGVM